MTGRLEVGQQITLPGTGILTVRRVYVCIDGERRAKCTNDRGEGFNLPVAEILRLIGGR